VTLVHEKGRSHSQLGRLKQAARALTPSLRKLSFMEGIAVLRVYGAFRVA
jgi:hypothetical protein